MKPKPPAHDPDLARLVERQMRNREWARAQKRSAKTPRRAASEVEPFIAVSREVGLELAPVLEGLERALGWRVFDREILDAMAGDDPARRRLYQSMDQRDLGWLEQSLRGLMESEYPRNDYFRRLCETVLSLARRERCIFVGRGIDRILPAGVGLRVRFVAPLEHRIESYAESCGLTQNEARDSLKRMQALRSRFIRGHFGVEATDPLRHDLVVNLYRWSPEQAVELVLTALRLSGVPATAGA